MPVFIDIVVLLLLLYVVIQAVVSIGPHLWIREDLIGNPSAGLVVFVESTRFAGVPWGKYTVAKGLRHAGYKGRFLYWPFHSTLQGCLVLSVLADTDLHERQADRLAKFLAEQRGAWPQRPLYLVGYSAGAYIAVRALELLENRYGNGQLDTSDDISKVYSDHAMIDSAVLLAGCVDPGRDLSNARRMVRKRFVVTYSIADWALLGLGTMLAGTCDRRHTASLGMVGPRPAATTDAAASGCVAVTSVAWSPADMALGHWGDHFGAASPGYIARKVAPLLW